MDRPFLGRGWGFPTALDADGRIVPVTGEAAVEQAVRLILSTAVGERVMRPDFGCGLHGRIFEPGTTEATGQLIGDIRSAIARWEHRAELVDLSIGVDETDASRRLIELTIQIKGTNSRFNLVYPFYVDGGAEVADV